MLSLAFSELGRDTQVAYDGPAALRLTENFQPRLALLDIGLPGMNGYALARQFRLRAGSDDISLIAVTRYGRKSDIALVLQSGFDEHLVKPVEFEKLQALLLRVLRK